MLGEVRGMWEFARRRLGQFISDTCMHTTHTHAHSHMQTYIYLKGLIHDT